MNEVWTHLSTDEGKMWTVMAALIAFMAAMVKHRWALADRIATAREEEHAKTEQREVLRCREQILELKTAYEKDITELQTEVRRLRRVLRRTLIHVDAEVAKRTLLEVNTTEDPAQPFKENHI